LSPADVLAGRPPSRAGIDAELADIAQRRRTDRGAYFKDETLHARELELLALRDKAVRKRARAMAAFVPTARTAVTSTRNSPRSTSIGARNRVAYMRDVATREWELQLFEAREQGTEAVRYGEQTGAIVDSVLEPVTDRQAFEHSFDTMFHTLPKDSKRAIREELARPVEAPMRQASTADVNRFASSQEGAACVRKLGKDAPSLMPSRTSRHGCSGST
jgi:hypothetical protein